MCIRDRSGDAPTEARNTVPVPSADVKFDMHNPLEVPSKPLPHGQAVSPPQPESDNVSQSSQPEPELRRSSRVSRPPSKWWQGSPSTANVAAEPVHHCVEYCMNAFDVPRSYHEAMSSENVDVWGPAIAKEEASISRNDTWELVPRKPYHIRTGYISDSCLHSF